MRKWIVVLVLCAGCSSVEYRTWSPSVRTFSDEPGVRDYYVGVDAEFVVRDSDRSRAAGKTAEDRSYDPLNPPVAWERQSPALLNPATTASADPAN